MKRKSQVTPFIIAGLVVLLMFIILYNYKLQNTIINNTNIEDESLLPLVTYVQGIVENLVNEESLKIGLYGNIPNLNKTEMIQKGVVSFEDLGIDYYSWDYKNYPKIEDFEKYISDIVTQRISNIFQNEYLSNYYNIEEKGNLVIFTKINENSIVIHLNKKLIITKLKDKSVTELNEFYVTIKSDFGKLLNEAYEIHNYLVNQSVLETFAMQILYSGDFYVDSMEFNCLKNRFLISDLQDQYDEISKNHFKFLNYKYFIESLNNFNHKQYYLAYAINNSDSDYKMDIKVFDSVLFKSNPSKNGYIESMSTSVSSSFLKMLCINVFHQFYTFRQPLIIDLNYKNSQFRLPLVVDVLNNQPKKKNNNIYSSVDGEYVESFCEQKSADESTILVLDSKTDEFIDNVSVTVKCLNYYTCYIGELEQGSQAGSPYIKQRLPECENYEFILSKDGYETTSVFLPKDDSNIYLLDIVPYIDVDLELNYVTKMSSGVESGEYKRQLDEGEFVSFVLGNDYYLFYKEDELKVKVPYRDGVYILNSILIDEDNNFRYFSENYLNVSSLDFRVENPKIQINLYGFENIDNEDEEKLYEMMDYGKQYSTEIKIR
ncbi:MAG: hypothetical protein PHT94_01845 [Candidatus Nanoarchaeia archaeon]|nr:hypothetical protein [Candidatus Nanoarchaeia archaeon]